MCEKIQNLARDRVRYLSKFVGMRSDLSARRAGQVCLALEFTMTHLLLEKIGTDLVEEDRMVLLRLMREMYARYSALEESVNG